MNLKKFLQREFRILSLQTLVAWQPVLHNEIHLD